MSVENRTSFGREAIYTSYDKIDKENIREVVQRAMQIHESNSKDIEYLLNYEKGKQPILTREKQVRSEINIKVVENHASQIVNFKLSYIFGSPIRYVQKAESESKEKNGKKDDLYVTALNEMCFDEHKHVKDQELAKMFLTCGVGYRGAFPNNGSNFSPFRIVNLDPRSTFIVYGADVFHKPMLAVTYWKETDDKGILTNVHYTAYTDTKVYEFDNVMIGEIKESVNGIGCIPIVEYKQDYERMGCFERVIGLLDAINVCTSDRINGLAQFVQSFLWFDNIDIDASDFKSLKDAGAFSTQSREGNQAKIELIESSLNQTEIQSLSDYLYNQLLQICCIPSREAQSGSTTGQSSMLAGGWQEAEEEAHRLEEMFDEGEKQFLNVVKHILDRTNDTGIGEIKLRDIDIRFSRNKIANMLVKTQGLLNMKTFGIHPRIAIQTADLFSDAQQVFMDSQEYLKKAYLSENGNNGKDLQSNPQGDDPATVKNTQNEQMAFVGK